MVGRDKKKILKRYKANLRLVTEIRWRKKWRITSFPSSTLKPYTNDTTHWGKGWGLWISTPMNSISTNTIKVNYIKK